MKALISILLFLTAVFNSSMAQVILPLGTGQNNSLNITCSYGDKMWVVCDDGQNYTINKWDGNFWIQYKNIPDNILSSLATTHQFIGAKAVYYHKDALYVSLANTVTGKLLLLKNAGKNWEVINTDKIFVEGNLTFISANDTLLICGKITVDALPKSILKINQTDCEVYAGAFANQNISPEYKDFEYCGNKIWAIGIFSSPTDLEKHFAVLENKAWKTVDNPPLNNGFWAMGKYNNRLVAAGYDFDGQKSFSLQASDITKWNEISNGLTGWEIISISDFLQVGQNLWATGKFFNKGANKLATLAYWNGNTWAVPPFDYIGDDVKLNGTNEVLISGKFYDHQGLLLNKTGKLSFGTALIAGKVFYDLNQNCTQDFGENPAQGIALKLITEDIYTLSDYNGRYYFPVDMNTSIHAVELQTPLYHIATCSSTRGVKHVSDLTVAGVDFGITPTSGHTDLSVSINDFTGWRARQGFDEQYKICVTNKGTKKTEKSRLIFTPDTRLLNWTFSETPASVQNNIREWDIKALQTGESYCLNAKAVIPMQVSLGEKLIFEAKITINADENSADNQMVLNEMVVAAIDPNDKATKQDYIIAPTLKALDYNIRFQNTGNDTAYNITITDTIDASLIITAKGINYSSSHYYDFAPTYWINSEGKYRYKLAWIFPDIRLADLNTNEPESHGYINYTLAIKPNLALGSLVRNRAFIYFDYQEPILTNTAKNLVSLEGNIKPVVDRNRLSVYPNPATDKLFISNPLKSDVSIVVLNSLGQPVISRKVSAGSELVIETSSLSKGIYLINAGGYSTFRVLIN